MEKRERSFDIEIWKKKKFSKENKMEKLPDSTRMDFVGRDFLPSYNEHNKPNLYHNYDSARVTLPRAFIVVWQEHDSIF